MRSSFCHRIALRAPFLQSPLLNPEAESTSGLVLLMISPDNLVLAGTMKEKETGMERHIEVPGRDSAGSGMHQATWRRHWHWGGKQRQIIDAPLSVANIPPSSSSTLLCLTPESIQLAHKLSNPEIGSQNVCPMMAISWEKCITEWTGCRPTVFACFTVIREFVNQLISLQNLFREFIDWYLCDINSYS